MHIKVPFHSQEAQDAKHFTNDCGAACASMVIEWAGLGRPSVDALSLQTYLKVSDSAILNPFWVERLLSDSGIPAETRAKQSADEILNTVDKTGFPAIAPVFWSDLPNRAALPDWFGGHYVVVCGQEGGKVYINDPDFWGSRSDQGRDLAVGKDDFALALSRTKLGGNVVYVTARPGQQPRPDSATPAQPAPAKELNYRRVPTGQAHVWSDALWLRSLPAGAQLKLLSYNDPVTVKDRAPVVATLNGNDAIWVAVLVPNVGEGWVLESGLHDPNSST